MKLLDRYMSAVAHYLPENRRDEITRELRSNILDQLEHLAEPDQEPSEAQVAEVLNSLGHPQKVAYQFLPRQQLVSEALFPFYKQVLGYALLLVFLVELIKLSVAFISNSYVPMASILLGYTFGLFTGFINHGLLAFAIVTGIFYVLSNPPGGKSVLQPYRCWRAEQLPPIVHDWQRIGTCDLAGEIGLNILVVLMLFHQIWMPEEQLQNIDVTIAADIVPWLYLLGALTIASLFLNVWNIRYGYWTGSKLIVNLFLNGVSAIVFIILSREAELFLPGEKLKQDMLGLVDVLNTSFKIGFLIAALYLLYEVGRDIYRVTLLGGALRSSK